MNEERKKLLIELLKEVNPKEPYGTELFDALLPLNVSTAIEMVCLRHVKKGKVDVYLTQRSLDDTAYPGEWHCPGSFIRPGEEIKDVFARIVQKEIKAGLVSTRFIADVNHPTEARGHVISKVYLCALEEKEGLKGTWFPTNQLPEKTVESHCKRIIPAAFGAFVAENSSICT